MSLSLALTPSSSPSSSSSSFPSVSESISSSISSAISSSLSYTPSYSSSYSPSYTPNPTPTLSSNSSNNGTMPPAEVGFDFNPYSTTLAICYGIIALPILFQIARILYYRHNVWSFQFSFLAASLLWALIRMIFWICAQAPIEKNWGMNLLYWLPVNLQFTTFCLVCLFYASMVHKNKWQSYRRYYIAAVWASSLLLLAMTTVWYYIFEKVDTSATSEHDALENISQYIDFVLWLGLVVGLLYYSWRLASKMHKSGVIPAPLQVQGISPKMLLCLNVMLAILFLTRSILFMLAPVVGPLDSLRYYKNRSTLDAGAFVAFAIWDITPTLIVLFLFRRIPTVGYSQVKSKIPAYGSFGGGAQGLFENPQRYDLDEDEHPEERGLTLSPRSSTTLPPPFDSPFAVRFDGSFHMPDGYRMNSVN